MLKENNISEELKQISPAVANLPNTTPFSVPQGYFEQLTSRILENVHALEIRAEQEPELSPLLASLKQENPFQLPDNYFKEFRIQKPEADQPAAKIFTWQKIISYSVAASIAGLMAWQLFFIETEPADQFITLQKTEAQHQSLSTESIQTFLNEAEKIDGVTAPTIDIVSDDNLLVEMTPMVVSEMLKEIPENDISSYMVQAGANEMLSLN